MPETPETSDRSTARAENTAAPAVLNYPLLSDCYMRALTWHDLTHQQVLLAMRAALGSFSLGSPYAWMPTKVDLGAQIGMARSKVTETLQVLHEYRAVLTTQVDDGWILTPIPPSSKWPWMVRSRLKSKADEVKARQIEKELARGTLLWPQQAVLFGPSPADEIDFQQALAIEQMHEALVEAHKQAAHGLLGARTLPVTVCLPTLAPARPSELSSHEGPTRPQEAGCRVEPTPSCNPAHFATPARSEEKGASSGEKVDPAELARWRAQIAAEMGVPIPTVPPEAEAEVEWEADVFPNKERVPFSGTDVFPNKERPIKDIEASKLSDRQHQCLEGINEPSMWRSRKRNSAQIPKREELPHLAETGENDVIDWLRWALGQDVMTDYGGWWRWAYRANRGLVLDVCLELKQRTGPQAQVKPPRNRGGWMRDLFLRSLNPPNPTS